MTCDTRIWRPSSGARTQLADSLRADHSGSRTEPARRRSIRSLQFTCNSTGYIAIFTMTVSALIGQASSADPPAIHAERLPDLPCAMGYAGAFAGVAGGALLVGGGTNFPQSPPWEKGKKVWYKEVYVLPAPDAKWLQGFELPHPMAYGISLTTTSGLLCIGGNDENNNLDDVFLLKWDGKTLTSESLPSLPHPTSRAAGAIVGTAVYVAGGQAGPNPASGPSYSYFWSLNLTESAPKWRELPTWPGPERFYAIAGSNDQSFYLFSGIRAIEDKPGQRTLEYLKDAYRFDTSAETWERLADLPHPNAAVATPAPNAAGGFFLLGVGADGAKTDAPMNERPGFGRTVTRFDIASQKYETFGTLPFGVAAVAATEWHNAIVVPTGEIGPGVRTTAVWSISRESLVDSR